MKLHRTTTSIRSTFVAIVIGATAILLLVNIIGIREYGRIAVRRAQVLESQSARITLARAVERNYHAQIREWKNVLLRGHEIRQYHEYLSRFYEHERQTTVSSGDLITRLADDSASKRLAERFLEDHEASRPRYRAALRTFNSSVSAPSQTADEVVRGVDRPNFELIADIERLIHQEAGTLLRSLDDDTTRAETVVTTASVSVVVGWLLLLLWVFDARIQRRLMNAVAVANRIAEDDLSVEVAVERADEVGELLSALEIMRNNLITSRMERIEAHQEREKAREDLLRAQSRKQLQDIIDSMVTFVGLYTPDGVVVEVNRAPLEAAGLSRSQVIGVPLWETYWWCYSPFAIEQVKEALKRAAQGESVRYDVPIRVGDERFVTIDVTFGPVRDSDGNVVQLIGSAVDVTDRIHAQQEQSRIEERIRETQKLESLGVLAGGIAHDFNNLLVGVLANAEFAREQLPKASPLQPHLAGVETAALRAADLCRQMLAYSGRGRLVVGPTDLNEIVREMADLLRASVSKKIELRTDYADGLPAINADSTQIRQVVMNLLTNAAESIGVEIGAVSIRTYVTDCDRGFLDAAVVGDSVSVGTFVCLEITDSGCGMDEGMIDKVFDPFFTTKFTGRGLGLSAVLGIIRGHGGAMRVSSQIGQGTTFEAVFPAIEQSAPQRASEGGTVDHFRGKGAILLADDEEMVLRAVRIMLENADFSVLPARDGVEAVDLFRKHSSEIVCVILDLTMPGMNGMEALNAIKEIRDDVPAILASGFSGAEITESVEGDYDFLGKPFRRADLMQTLERALAKRATPAAM